MASSSKVARVHEAVTLKMSAVLLLAVLVMEWTVPGASAAAVGRINGRVMVSGQPERAVLTRGEFKADGAIVARLFAVPVDARQPLDLSQVASKLVDIKADGTFEHELEEGAYLIGLTTRRLALENQDESVQIRVGEEIIAFPALKVEVKAGETSSLNIAITSESADRLPSEVFITEPRGLGADPQLAEPPRGNSATFPGSDADGQLFVVAIVAMVAVVVGFVSLRLRRSIRP
jgi:hypothetical protein